MGKDLDINFKIQNYIKDLSKKLHPVQSEIISYNESLGDIKRMQIAISQCYFLELITKISKAKKILEIGTFTGLSTLSMALGLPEDGMIIALDKNSETNTKAKEFFKKAEQDKKIKTIVNPALDTLNELKKENFIFDIIFIDADKENYINYFNQVSNKLSKNGIIISDNVLWSGKVLDSNQMDEETSTLVKFNKIINNDKRFKSIILPIRDGISISRLV